MGKIISVVVFVIGFIPLFMNFLWLIGVCDKPSGDLLEARWLFSFVVIMFYLLIIGPFKEFLE